MKKIVPLYIAWTIAAMSTFGSLFFSEILHFPPCVLCWYQRIFMYPLLFILTIGILKKDKHLSDYVLSLAIPGWLIAFYHMLLYYKIIPDTISPCSLGVSCTTKFIEYFGFITIPFLSWLAFTILIAAMFMHRKRREK